VQPRGRMPARLGAMAARAVEEDGGDDEEGRVVVLCSRPAAGAEPNFADAAISLASLVIIRARDIVFLWWLRVAAALPHTVKSTFLAGVVSVAWYRWAADSDAVEVFA